MADAALEAREREGAVDVTIAGQEVLLARYGAPTIDRQP